ncbi:hypothetical protein M0813_02341 [Anaeramoeba flamelloides]|uniref:Uncharacterized protein n=1 Tax=Anaeramoeba flamelloides TaxID=1746091 RepID=A0ABQ8YIH7_9EUKA|nr:hypothetical protein M0813_02341 [Anaeramoeba flamelloides]
MANTTLEYYSELRESEELIQKHHYKNCISPISPLQIIERIPTDLKNFDNLHNCYALTKKAYEVIKEFYFSLLKDFDEKKRVKNFFRIFIKRNFEYYFTKLTQSITAEEKKSQIKNGDLPLWNYLIRVMFQICVYDNWKTNFYWQNENENENKNENENENEITTAFSHQEHSFLEKCDFSDGQVRLVFPQIQLRSTFPTRSLVIPVDRKLQNKTVETKNKKQIVKNN